MRFYSYQKRGGGVGTIAVSKLKGGAKSFEIVLTWELDVLAILKGAQNVCTLSKGGEGGGYKNTFSLS